MRSDLTSCFLLLLFHLLRGFVHIRWQPQRGRRGVCTAHTPQGTHTLSARPATATATATTKCNSTTTMTTTTRRISHVPGSRRTFPKFQFKSECPFWNECSSAPEQYTADGECAQHTLRKARTSRVNALRITFHLVLGSRLKAKRHSTFVGPKIILSHAMQSYLPQITHQGLQEPHELNLQQHVR